MPVPPKPLEEKRRQGNPGHQKLPDRSKTVALAPVDGLPPIPISMAQSPAAIATWQLIWGSEGQRWLSPQVDRLAVESICHLAAEIETYRQLAAAEPLLEEPITTSTGVVVGTRMVANPAVDMLRKAEAQMMKGLSELGFNPTARSRLGLAEVKRESKLLELLEKNRRTSEERSEAAAGRRRRPRAVEDPEEEIIDAQVIIAADG